MKRQHCNRSSGNLQVSGKQDTYYLEIKEDLSKFYCFSFKKLILVSRWEKAKKLNDNIKTKSTFELNTFEKHYMKFPECDGLC